MLLAIFETLTLNFYKEPLKSEKDCKTEEWVIVISKSPEVVSFPKNIPFSNLITIHVYAYEYSSSAIRFVTVYRQQPIQY